MKKVRANALWNELSAKQREKLDQWLFEERVGYTEILKRAKTEMGFKGSESSLRRYYTRRQQERVTTEFTELRDELAAISAAPTDANALRVASMKLLGQFLFRMVRQSPEKVKDWAPVASLMLDNDRNELLREVKDQEFKIRQEAMAFAREKFQFDTMERALKALPELQELAEAKKDPQTRDYEENIHTNRVLRAIFGFVGGVHPESAKEEAEMRAAKKKREARREREAQWQRERIIEAQPPTPSSPYYKEYMEEQVRREKNNEKKLQTPSSQAPEKLQTSSSNHGEHAAKEDGHEDDDAKYGKGRKATAPRKPTKQYQEYLDKLKQWEENREVLGWQDVPQPEWSGRWSMMEEDE